MKNKKTESFWKNRKKNYLCSRNNTKLEDIAKE